MPERCYRILRLGHRGLVPLAVSAILAFALFPGLAVAQDSSGVQYSDAPPTPTGKSSQDDPANASNVDRADRSGQSSTGSGSTGDAKSRDGNREGDGGAAGKGGDDPGKGGQGDGAGGTAGGDGDDRGGDERAVTQADPSSAAADDGGSSPLVPILIALAVLGAISFGIVAMRKRGEDDDSGVPASPEAG
jgi:cobalamin biosynthesis Mg chelatase CobN